MLPSSFVPCRPSIPKLGLTPVGGEHPWRVRPTGPWIVGNPADHGLNRTLLAMASQAVADRVPVRYCLVVTKDGRIMHEQYYANTSTTACKPLPPSPSPPPSLPFPLLSLSRPCTPSPPSGCTCAARRSLCGCIAQGSPRWALGDAEPSLIRTL